MGTIVWQFMVELGHIFSEVFFHGGMDESAIMLVVLGLVDVVMIANLLIMVIIGGYETFVSRIKLDDHPDHPERLSHVNADVLKTKLAMSIIAISSIHLLASFIRAEAILEEPRQRGARRRRRSGAGHEPAEGVRRPARDG